MNAKLKGIPAGVLGNIDRPGHRPISAPAEQVSPQIEGLDLSEIQYKPLDFFRPNPDNHVFDSLKDAKYMDALKADIKAAGAIINPLVSMQDGLLIEGHSRLKIARELEQEGHSLGRIPVRLILTPLTTKQIKERMYLGNLSRFEIDQTTRAYLYSQIWPGYFLDDPKAGRRKKGDTVSPFPETPIAPAEKKKKGDTVSPLPGRAEISKATGISERQVKRIAKVTRSAANEARAQGKDAPSLLDITEAQERENMKRRVLAVKEPSTMPRSADHNRGAALATLERLQKFLAQQKQDSKTEPLIRTLTLGLEEIALFLSTREEA